MRLEIEKNEKKIIIIIEGRLCRDAAAWMNEHVFQSKKNFETFFCLSCCFVVTFSVSVLAAVRLSHLESSGADAEPEALGTEVATVASWKKI